MIAIISVLKNRCISKFNQKDTKLVIKNIAYFFQKNDMYTLLNVTNSSAIPAHYVISSFATTCGKIMNFITTCCN